MFKEMFMKGLARGCWGERPHSETKNGNERCGLPQHVNKLTGRGVGGSK